MSKVYRSTKDVAALVRESLRKELPRWKFSVTVREYSGGSSINLSLMSGPEAVCEGNSYVQLNHHTFKNNQLHQLTKPPFWNNGAVLTEVGWNVMAKASEILGREHWDESDIQSDYFSCSFYMHVNIGKWNQPFMVKGAK